MKTKSTLTSWVVSKGAFCTIPWFYGRWKRLNRREEKAFCTFSQQLNNPHALRIDRLPREIEKGRDGEKGRKRGRAWVFGSKGACCAWWYCGTFVCVGSAVSSLGPGQGPHSPRFLWLSSLEEGVIHGGDTTPYVLPDSPSMNKACWIWRFPDLWLCFLFTATLKTQGNLKWGRRKTENKMQPQQKEQRRQRLC